nr:immunoglobulin heavy chain junction region [Macaca mulatta]MOW76321.1 immunoglobulin heavy chain junction region [Macaca mulatta]MOW76572.1 immunoglobulin heavy chain junction region [Macaca mulatta]MOW77234.1 immunoglobulin heavy chain junction region [Macaca mulatta]MOW79061.1 immunoglobulin heavy chain junction region [Macaca mulatta]
CARRSEYDSVYFYHFDYW